MARRSGNSFGSFAQQTLATPKSILPITTEFSKGPIPNSIAASNRESSWARWRRGYELAVNNPYTNNFSYPFKYQVPFSKEELPSNTKYPDILGVFQGFPTLNRELGMHWAAKKTEGSIRFDQIEGYQLLFSNDTDYGFKDYLNTGSWLDDNLTLSSYDLYVESLTEDENNWYVKLNGSWSASHKLPPPFYIDLGPGKDPLKPLIGDILEDRILVKNGSLISKDTINPATRKRYGYIQAVVTAVDEITGVLTLRKRGSVEVTPDKALITPASRGPQVNRYLNTGPSYCCTCQDFTRRQYSYMRNLKESNRKAFPRSGLNSIKPGRYDVLKRLGIVDSSAMTETDVNRIMEIVAPGAQFELSDGVVSETGIDVKATRDNPGIYADFGYIYLRSTDAPALTGSAAEGMPGYEDYSTKLLSSDSQAIPQLTIENITDFWTPVLDEIRYCKHVYAMRFQDDVFPPEPSDFPVEDTSMATWEQNLINETQKQNEKKAQKIATEALSYMDVPPYNCQTQAVQPMLQRLFNIPLSYIKIEQFIMYDKYGLEYQPALGEKPSV